MSRTRDPEKCKQFIEAINEGMNQKEASALVGWSESSGSRYYKQYRENNAVCEKSTVNTGTMPDKTDKALPEAAKRQQEPDAESMASHTDVRKMINLNVTGYYDYLASMAGHQRQSVTKYIRGLIAADMEKNWEKYEKIKSI